MPLITYTEFAAGNQVGGSIREDLLDFIETLSPKDTPLYNNLSSIQVNAGYVEYLQDSLAARGHNAWPEGGAATDVALTTPSRVASIVQNFQKHFHVSGRQIAVLHAGLANMVSYQEMKKAAELKNDFEHTLHRGSAVTGQTGATAPQLAGMLNRLTTNFTASSGTTLTELVFNNIVTLTFANPVNLREVYCPMRLKRTINQYTTSVQRYLPAGDRRQLDLIDVYESEVGVMSIFKSRDQLESSANNTSGNSFIAIDPDYFSIGWLRAPKTMELGLDGDRVRKMMVAEMTLIARHEAGGAGGTGFVPFIN